jgi:hypothetical protein
VSAAVNIDLGAGLDDGATKVSFKRNEQVERVRTELSVLDGVIEYADRMIYSDNRQVEYGPLRRHAYGKTVVIETENQGTLTFRLSSTPVVYPKAASGYATPHSPVGRLCAYLRPGDESESPRWGAYRVVEIRLFERFDGAQFEKNVRNFLRMTVQDETSDERVTDLHAYLKGEPAAKPSRENESGASSPESIEKRLAGVPPVEPSVPQADPAVTVDMMHVIDDVEEPNAPAAEFDEDDADADVAGRVAEDYFGLGETFYVNRTREQDEIMSRSPIGPMFVEGVAGSGKTSAALGRTKMLCDFNATSVHDEGEFRDFAGHDLAYWSGKYAGQFSQEASMGFVRTGELIQYLKETCRRLDLPNLPVQEYPELRSRLRQHRRVERNRPGTARWTGLSTPRDTQVDTTMAWLKAADRAIAAGFAKEFEARLPTVDELASAFHTDARTRALRIVSAASDQLRSEVNDLSRELADSNAGGAFVLDRLAARVLTRIRRVRNRVLGKDVVWVAVGSKTWFASNEQDMAAQLVAANVQLFLRTSARLVFLDERGPLDSSLKLLSLTGEPIEWSADTRGLMGNGRVLVRDTTGKTVHAVPSDAKNLLFRLMPDSQERLYVWRDDALRPLSVQRGIGKELMALNPSRRSGAAEASEDDERSDEQDGTLGSDKRRSVDAVFAVAARRALLQPLTFIADAYSESLTVRGQYFPDRKVASAIEKQLAQRKLSDADIDLLLCIGHSIGRGFEGVPATLSEPSFYQSVFVDEVQDFSEQQIYLMVEQAQPEYRAVTVVGDRAQKLHNGGSIDVSACFPGGSVLTVSLTENLRQLEVPGLAWLSSCFRAQLQGDPAEIIPSPELAKRMRQHADPLGGPQLVFVNDEEELVAHVVDTLDALGGRETVAVLLPNAEIAAALHARCKGALSDRMIDTAVSEKIDLSRRHVRHFTGVANSKGLEFDVVIVPYLERYKLSRTADANGLYVALTRPRRRLVLISDANRPASPFDAAWARFQAATPDTADALDRRKQPNESLRNLKASQSR